MTVLAIYHEHHGVEPELIQDGPTISDRLMSIGVLFEQWPVVKGLSRTTDQADVLSAYSGPIERLTGRFGFQTIDVIQVQPKHPQKDELRKKFLAEHTHDDFEVRFFVDGRGLFYLHIRDKIYCILCGRGDLLSVPAGTTHWFDMGNAPDFRCIRFFKQSEGWVATFTGNDIASRFPDFDTFVADLR